MSLNEIWFGLFLLVIAGYLILDGFDMGVGILHFFLAKNDTERRVMLNSIGPVWDGNEVWLVIGGGVLFAAFPLAYASLFSGFYVAFMLVLLVMILRTVAIEFRSKRPSKQWRRTWDFIFSMTSLGLALLLGIAFGNIIMGVPLDAEGNMRVTLPELLSPLPLLVGITSVTMFALHGGIFMTMKADGELKDRLLRWLPRIMVLFFILNTLLVLLILAVDKQVTTRYLVDIWPGIFPLGALIALVTAWYMLRKGQNLYAFVASGLMIALLLISGGIGVFPNLLISTIDPAYNLTIYNAASAPNTLTVMLIVALIGIPVVLLYTAGVYYFFRGKTVLEEDSY